MKLADVQNRAIEVVLLDGGMHVTIKKGPYQPMAMSQVTNACKGESIVINGDSWEVMSCTKVTVRKIIDYAC